MAKTPAWENDWSIRLRIWIERNGAELLGPARLELLEAIDRWHSISAAARNIGISYRHAWMLVDGVNRAAGRPLVESAVGGKRGGGARLTELGAAAVATFRQLEREIHAAAAQVLPRVVNLGERTAAVHVAAAISLEQVLGQLLADQALRQPTVRVRAIYGASNELADHILAGAPCDLFLSADAAPVERLERAGLCAAGAGRVVAVNGLAIVAQAGAAIRLRRPQDLARADVGRVALADPESPLGAYTRDYLAQLGLADGLHDRTVLADSSRGVLSTVIAGRADVGLVYTSDAVNSPQIRLVAQPKSEAAVAEYWAVVPCTAGSADEAERLLAFLLSPAARRRFRSFGFQPSKQRA